MISRRPIRKSGLEIPPPDYGPRKFYENNFSQKIIAYAALIFENLKVGRKYKFQPLG